MKNVDFRPEEEKLVASAHGLCEVVRQVAAIDQEQAASIRAEVVAWLDWRRQAVWDGLPDRYKRELGKKTTPIKEPAKPSQAIPSKT